MRTTVVFSAGGAAAWAYHAGVIEALDRAAGFDVATADLIVGTSAGSAIAASVRSGAAPRDMLRSVTTPPSPEQRAEMLAHVKTSARRIRLLSPALTHKATKKRAGWLLATSGMLPEGFFPTEGLGRFPGVMVHEGWPSGLYIPAVSVDTAETVVFGKDVTHVSVTNAVQASSAVPGMFAPKVIDGRRFVDGGTRSGTHAELALDADPELVVISSLITRPARRPTSRFARRLLRRELAVLRRRGVPVVLVEPDEDHKELLSGFPRRDPDRLDMILDVAASDVARAVRHNGGLL